MKQGIEAREIARELNLSYVCVMGYCRREERKRDEIMDAIGKGAKTRREIANATDSEYSVICKMINKIEEDGQVNIPYAPQPQPKNQKMTLILIGTSTVVMFLS